MTKHGYKTYFSDMSSVMLSLPTTICKIVCAAYLVVGLDLSVCCPKPKKRMVFVGFRFTNKSMLLNKHTIVNNIHNHQKKTKLRMNLVQFQTNWRYCTIQNSIFLCTSLSLFVYESLLKTWPAVDASNKPFSWKFDPW